MEAIRKLWRESVLEGASYYVVRELDRIDIIEMEAWSEWNRSKGMADKETLRQKGVYVGAQALTGEPLTGEEVNEVMRSVTAIKKAPGIVRREVQREDNKTLLMEFEKTDTSEERMGDPRYLAVVMKCTEMRIKLLGLDSQPTVEVEEPQDARDNPKLILLERLSVMGGRINAARKIRREQDNIRNGVTPKLEDIEAEGDESE